MNRQLMLCAVALLGACDDFNLEDYTPKARYDAFDVQDVDFTAAEGDFVFQVDNPNPIGIGLASFEYGLELGGVEILSGDNPDGFRLKANDATELRFPVKVEFANLYELTQAVRGEDHIGFTFSGRMAFDTPIGPIPWPFKAEGSFPALREPKVKIKGAKVRPPSLGNLSAGVEVELEVDNDHGSAVAMDNFDYALTINGASLAGGVLEEVVEVDGASKKSVVIPVEIGLGGVIGTISSLLSNGGQAEVRLEAQLDVDTPFGVVPLDLDQIADTLFQVQD